MTKIVCTIAPSSMSKGVIRVELPPEKVPLIQKIAQFRFLMVDDKNALLRGRIVRKGDPYCNNCHITICPWW